MNTAAKPRLPKPSKPSKPLSRTVRLTERVQLDKRRVDAEAGVVFDVKILGHHSDNNRFYSPGAMKAAIPLYENKFVNIDHPDKPLAQRSSLDRTAWLENVRYVDSDGLRGDLHFLLPLDDYQKKVIWAAENKPSAWGLSHNADGRGAEDRQGRFVIEAITDVRSVDLVPEPATNRSLFESHTMQTTLRQLIEASKAKPLFKRLLEMPEDEMPPLDMPMDAPPEAPVEGDWKADLVAAIGKLVSSENEEDHKLAQKVMSMLKPQAVAPEVVTEEEEEEKEDDEEEKEEPVAESRKRKATPDTITLTEAKSLCKLVGLAEDAGLLGMLDGAPREKGMSLLEWAKGKAVPSKGVRSQGAGGVDTTTTPKFPTSPDERRKLLAAV